jgi:deazaflavin-dependent oxidoreductase (nitroreductase family)
VTLPRRLARFNRVVTNRVARPLAAILPGFAVVEHTGRRSGSSYRTPVNAFRSRRGGYVIALTYGRASDWVANVVAAGECVLVRCARTVRAVQPVIVSGEAAVAALPRPVRPIVRLLGVDEVLVLDAA